MTVVAIVFLMFGCWALISASQQWGARRDSQAAAAAAARAGAQISPAELQSGVVALDPVAARQRAQSVLDSLGASGTVTVSGPTVVVSATQPVDYAFPAPGFAGAVTASASATASPGVRGDEGG